MGMRFQFATANQILFGANESRTISQRLKDMGKRVFLITGKNQQRIQWLADAIHSEGLSIQIHSITGEPAVPFVLEAVQQARTFKADVVVGIGGGSVLDTGKVVAALLTNAGNLMDYLEVIGKGQPIQNKPVPYVAAPTTAGTGAEVTKNAVIASPEHQVKVSMRHPWMIPDLAIVDPVLTHSLPADITASTGLDTLTQLIEPFVTHSHNPLIDAICIEGLTRVARSLKIVYENGKDAQAREDMAIASLFGGLALANAKLGAVHGIAGPMGGMFAAPHGVICARLLPHVIQANIQALQQRNPESLLLPRFQKLGTLLTEKRDISVNGTISWIQTLTSDLAIPPLSTYGVNRNAFQELIEKCQSASSMKGNPIQLLNEELTEILEKATYE